MENKRIAIVTPYGAEPRLDNYGEFILAQTLQERGWDVRMYTYGMNMPRLYAHDTAYGGARVFRCRVRWGISPKLFFSLLFFRPRSVLCFHPKSMLNFSAYWSARFSGARFVATIVGIFHDGFIVDDVDDPYGHIKTNPILVTNFRTFITHLSNPWRWLWENYIFHMPTAHADTIVAINEDERRHVLTFYRRASECIYYCTPRFNTGEAKQPTTSVPERFLFFIGQVKRRKGWDTAIEALAILKKKGRDSHLMFVAPKDQIEEAVEYAKEKRVLDCVTFLTSISNEEKRWLYAHSECVLVPSRYESFGIPVFEAFLAKVPLCASNIPVFKEFLVDRGNAMLFRTGDPEGLANAVLTLDGDPKLCERLIAEGEKTAEKFDYRRMTDAYEKIIRNS